MFFSVDGHLGGVQFLSITDKNALNVLMHSLLCVHVWRGFFFAYLYSVGMLGHRICIYSALIEYFNVYQTMGLLCIKLSNVFHTNLHILYYKLFSIFNAALPN